MKIIFCKINKDGANNYRVQDSRASVSSRQKRRKQGGRGKISTSQGRL